jgi:hypothetical protein
MSKRVLMCEGCRRLADVAEENEELRAEIELLRSDLAEVDAVISVHANALDNSPRSAWPKGSILEKAISRHERRALEGK